MKKGSDVGAFIDCPVFAATDSIYVDAQCAPPQNKSYTAMTNYGLQLKIDFGDI